MNQVALTATGQVLVLVDGMDVFEGSEEVTRLDLHAHQPMEEEKEGFWLEGWAALALGLSFTGALWIIVP